MTRVSVIVPVWNERHTIGTVMDRLLGLAVDGVEFDVIVVHSRSSDGTEDILKRYSGDVLLLNQTSPKGKGNAVREGLLHATGDVVMIQDADLEYSFDDYEKLLRPIIEKRASFVLGVRNTKRMRTFESSPLTAALMNFGHKLFAGMVNLMLDTSISDPFTMFKVFRRSCIDGLEFQCERFDFDFELLIKLVRCGHIPLEVPVAYTSRCFYNGKKIRLIRDPMTWCWALARLWFN